MGMIIPFPEMDDLFPGDKDLIGVELLTPLTQDKSNLQMKTDYQLVIGYQKHL